MGIDFNESDILKDILNFKIVNRRKLEEKYGFKILDYTIEHINDFLCENNNGIIHKSKNDLYYFGKYYEELFKVDDRSINMKMSFRRELITLILLLGKEKLNIYKFNKQIRRNEQNTKNIQNDLKQILKIYNIKHSEYVKSANIEKLFENKNYDLNEVDEVRNVFIQAGAGIVFDSVKEKEYDEICHKRASVLNIFKKFCNEEKIKMIKMKIERM